jgi:hypothetical protein
VYPHKVDLTDKRQHQVSEHLVQVVPQEQARIRVASLVVLVV